MHCSGVCLVKEALKQGMAQSRIFSILNRISVGMHSDAMMFAQSISMAVSGGIGIGMPGVEFDNF